MTTEEQSERLKQLLDAKDQETISTFLREIQLLPGTKAETQDPTQRQIEEYRLAITGGIGKLVTAAGGVGALLAASGTAIGAFKDQAGETITVALIASGAVLLTVAILGLALILRADVNGRAAVATQVMEERGAVVSSLLEMIASVKKEENNRQKTAASKSETTALEKKEAEKKEAEKKEAQRKEREAAEERKRKEAEAKDLRVLLGLASFGTDIEITTAHGRHSVLGLRHEGGKVQVLQADRDWVDLSDIKSFTTKPPTSK